MVVTLLQKVERTEAQEVADSCGARYFECSAKNGVGVTELFTAIVDMILEQGLKSLDLPPPTLKLAAVQLPKKKSCVVS